MINLSIKCEGRKDTSGQSLKMVPPRRPVHIQEDVRGQEICDEQSKSKAGPFFRKVPQLSPVDLRIFQEDTGNQQSIWSSIGNST